jgi:hypothetical protein
MPSLAAEGVIQLDSHIPLCTVARPLSSSALP